MKTYTLYKRVLSTNEVTPIAQGIKQINKKLDDMYRAGHVARWIEYAIDEKMFKYRSDRDTTIRTVARGENTRYYVEMKKQ